MWTKSHGDGPEKCLRGQSCKSCNIIMKMMVEMCVRAQESSSEFTDKLPARIFPKMAEYLADFDIFAEKDFLNEAFIITKSVLILNRKIYLCRISVTSDT